MKIVLPDRTIETHSQNLCKLVNDIVGIAILKPQIFKYSLKVYPLIYQVNQAKEMILCRQALPSHNQPAVKAPSQLIL